MASIEVGIRIDMTAGVSFFGLEAVEVRLTLAGCQLVVVFEGD